MYTFILMVNSEGKTEAIADFFSSEGTPIVKGVCCDLNKIDQIDADITIDNGNNDNNSDRLFSAEEITEFMRDKGYIAHNEKFIASMEIKTIDG